MVSMPNQINLMSFSFSAYLLPWFMIPSPYSDGGVFSRLAFGEVSVLSNRPTSSPHLLIFSIPPLGL